MGKKTTLTKAEEFYIDNNLGKADEELAKDIGKPVAAVREHLHRTQGKGRVNKLLIREKGCVVMTEGASMAADESRKGYVNETDDAAHRRQSEHIHYLK